jgi:hypothetical protein
MSGRRFVAANSTVTAKLISAQHNMYLVIHPNYRQAWPGLGVILIRWKQSERTAS